MFEQDDEASSPKADETLPSCQRQRGEHFADNITFDILTQDLNQVALMRYVLQCAATQPTCPSKLALR
jgi:hypothetical protein